MNGDNNDGQAGVFDWRIWNIKNMMCFKDLCNRFTVYCLSLIVCICCVCGNCSVYALEFPMDTYLRMMRNDNTRYNFFNGVRHLMRERTTVMSWLEQNLGHHDAQVVVGCTFILTKTAEYEGSPDFYTQLLHNLRHDSVDAYNLYIFNAYEAAIWLNAHYEDVKTYLYDALPSEDLQQFAFLSLLIRSNEPFYDFRQHFTEATLHAILPHLNDDTIKYNATYATIILLLTGGSFPDLAENVDNTALFDEQGQQLWAFIQEKLSLRDTTLRIREFANHNLHTPNYLGWNLQTLTIYTLHEQEIDRGYMSPFH